MLRPGSWIEQRGMADHRERAARPPPPWRRAAPAGTGLARRAASGRGRRRTAISEDRRKPRGFCPSGLKNVVAVEMIGRRSAIIRVRRFSASCHQRLRRSWPGSHATQGCRTTNIVCAASRSMPRHRWSIARAPEAAEVSAPVTEDCDMAMKRTREPWMRADDFGRSLPRGVGVNLLVTRRRAGRDIPAAGARRQHDPRRRGFRGDRAARLGADAACRPFLSRP